MSLLRYLHLDVFAATPGGGNHLGVVIGADDWSAVQMQRFARWTALVETTFVLPPTDSAVRSLSGFGGRGENSAVREQISAASLTHSGAMDIERRVVDRTAGFAARPTKVRQAPSYRVRIFTPHKEIPFAGHPSIGSAHAVLECGLAEPRDGLLWQQCGAGVLPIRLTGHGATRELMLQSPGEQVLETGRDAHPLLPAALAGIELGALPPALVDGGRRWWLAEIADEASLRAWQPDHAAIGALARISDSMGLCVFARAAHAGYQLVVRAFPAGVGIVEDPASGAANGLIAAYITHAEPDGALARGYHVSQGREIGHDARLVVRIEHDAIWTGGRSHTVIDGTLDWMP